MKVPQLIPATFDPVKKTWYKPATASLYDLSSTLGHTVLEALSKHPANVGQICHEDGHEMRNWKIRRDSIRVSLNLQNLGLKEGDVISIAVGNSRHVAALVFGALLNGCPVNALDPTYGIPEIIHSLDITEPKLVVCEYSNYECVKMALKELQNQCPIYVFDVECSSGDMRKSALDLFKEHPQEKDFVPPTLTDAAHLPAFILSSSGTTGPPKAISISHAAMTFAIQRDTELTPSTRFFNFSSLFWVTGVLSLLMTTLNSTIRILVKQPYSPQLLLDIIKKRQVQFLMCSSAQLQLLFLEKYEEGHFKSLTRIYAVGGAVPKCLKQKIGIPIWERYGMTETCGVVVTNGELTSGVEFKILDDEGNALGIGERGEICIKPHFPFLGYYRNEKATKEVCRDGFIYSGDIGLIDENGIFKFLDRKKDILWYNDSAINPTDVEMEIQKMPGVALVNVVGIPHPIYDSLIAAVVVRSPGSHLTEVDVHKYAKEHLSSYKWFRGGVYFFDAMPMTVSGKILRRENAKIVTSIYERKPDVGFTYE